ncbi:MAG: GNAT family N-acetyltransferase [Porticoccaceae bacterium]|jgi:RimJ/RimL family protein N-acetyltransferase|nr:GNAT family N-acetyltransferase [Porticoccaceae bacterium]MDG1080352.1 GNAT family N-acetyltransferase [Porticoccaceae bacterium]MDG1081080.1 GNAT family N-acetyltransferase [Porticoccaceae bacterium]
MLRTERLILRPWMDADFVPFAKISSDYEVMKHYPRPLTKQESYSLGARFQSLIDKRGWGFWAVEIPNQKRFIGFVGLHIPKQSLPFSPCVEIGWRLEKESWGRGYATEAANESLRYAFGELELAEVFSFTTLANQRSQEVMKNIGMSNTGTNFMHPDIDIAHPQCEHVLYKITRQEWEINTF